MAKLFENLLASSLYAGAVALFRRLAEVNPIVVYYHLVSDDKVPHISNLYSFRNVRQFERDLDVLLRFFRPLSLQDFVRSFEGGQPPPKNSFILTFDDGLRECSEVVAPILRKKGVPAAFFLCSSFIDNKELAYDFKKSLLAGVLSQGVSKSRETELRAILKRAGIYDDSIIAALLRVDYARSNVLNTIADRMGYDFSTYLKSVRPYLSSIQAKELVKEGHALGGHSVDHPRYENIPLVEQLRQTRESMSFIKDNFDVEYRAFAFPSSDANVSTEFFSEMLREGVVDVFFGNHGLLRDPVRQNVQRFSMEKTDAPAEAILGRNYARRLAKKIIGRLEIRRPVGAAVAPPEKKLVESAKAEEVLCRIS